MPLSKIQDIGNQVTPNAGRRNIIINGAMQVAQRGDQASLTNGFTGVDRFRFISNGGAEVTGKQGGSSVSTPENGFPNSLHIDVTTADTSIASGDYALVRTIFEGKNLQNLKYGTSSAETLTLSFWVKSPKTGTHWVELFSYDSSEKNSALYTVNSANTWEKKTVSFAGLTTTAIPNDNTAAILVQWFLMAGSSFTSGTHPGNVWHNTTANRLPGQVNAVDSTDNNFYLTGVQLEVGSAATEFEHLSFGEDLSLCQRYYWKHTAEDYGVNQGATTSALSQWSTTSADGLMNFPVEMRAKPSGSYSDLSHFTLYVGGQTRTPTSWIMATRGGKWGTEHHFDWSSGITAAGGGWLRFQNTSGWYAYEAEL